jgi:hypothetical protein
VIELDLSNVGRHAPPTPSKWDIIPIHTSDRGTFKFCRRQWSWSSPSRLNLMPKASVHGIREPLWFGTGIHYALQKMYDPSTLADPVVEWEKWFDLQWKGGIVSPEEVSEFVDREPEPVYGRNGLDGEPDVDSAPIMYRVSGLREILPHPDEEHFAEVRDLGVGMMKFWKQYADKNDNFTVIQTEHSFSVPVLNPKTGEAYYAVDKREMPPDWRPNYEIGNIYGPLMRKAPAPFGQSGFPDFYVEKQVHARGKQDVIIQDNESGRFGLRDYKTAAEIGEDYFRHLELDEQCTSYLWAAEAEAKLHGLEYAKMEFIDYVAILKKYPKPPTLTTKGVPSINRKEESTTAAMFEKCIADLGLTDIFKIDPKWQSYYTWLLELGDKRFIQVKQEWRNPIQRKNAGIRLYYEARDMLNDPVPYPNPTKTYPCLNCIFRAPCIAAEDGSDYAGMLEDGYIPNWDR